MNKDIIYIDVEDDITAIIGKVKDAKQKIVALVPPKRIGVLQSAVNLRLLARAAAQTNKHLVIITNNPALMALTAAAKLPVAKNLQSKPEVAQIPALDIDDGEDVIDGSQLPVGELARTADATPLGAVAFTDPAIDEAVRENAAEAAPRALPPAPGQLPNRAKTKSGIKVPNFNKFRKKLLLIIVGAILLIAFLIWAVVFAAHATVLITARTTDSSVNAKVNLDPTLATDVAAGSIKTTTQQLKKTASVDFTATGTKDAGNKASGKMTVTRTSVSSDPIAVPAGTSFSSGNITFISTEGTTLAGTTIGKGGIVQDSATVAVVAAAIGDESNLSARPYQSNVGGISAQGTDMSGGSHRQIKIVSADDMQKATDQLTQQNTDAVKKQLAGQFSSNILVIDTTFKVDQPAPQATPAVGQEVPDGVTPKLTSEVTYSMAGVDKTEASKYLDTYFAQQIKNTSDQRVYDNGLKTITFTNVSPATNSYTANVVATAKIGPKIDDNAIKSIAKGKRYGEIQSSIEAIQGVDNVDVKFSPFWVSAAPSDVNKISVEFKLNGSK
jgi:hypothetical protein